MMKKNKKRLIILGSVVGIIAIIVIYQMQKETVIEYTSIVVEQGPFVQSVEETGVIDTDISVSYGWETNGRVVDVLQRVGNVVSSSAVIAELDSRVETNSLKQAVAQRSAAVARLNEVLVGVTEEDKQTYQARIVQAEASLAQAQTDLSKINVSVASDIAAAERAVDKARNDVQEVGDTTQLVLDAYADLLNALNATIPDMRDALTEADNILGVNNSFANDDFDAYLGDGDVSAKNGAEYRFPFVETEIDEVTLVLNGLTYTSSQSALDAAATQTQDTLLSLNVLLDLVLDALDGTTPQGTFTQSALEILKSGVITENSTISTDKTAVTNAMQAITTAKNARITNQIVLDDAEATLTSLRSTGAAQITSAESLVDIRRAAVLEAQASYNALVAPPRAVDLAALRADVARQQAAVEAAQIGVDDKSLQAIVSGTITDLDISIGENITANQEVVTIQSDTFKIEVDISESDIAKISMGDIAWIELDAYPNVTFLAYVSQIDPAATEISGVVYYSIELMLDMSVDGSQKVALPDDVMLQNYTYSIIDDTYDIRPGMSADVEIITFAKIESLIIPRRAIITDEGRKKVRVVTNSETGAFELRDIKVGLTGNDGKVEVKGGLSVGDEIITFIEESK